MSDQPLSAPRGSAHITPDGGRIPVKPLCEGQHWAVDPVTGCWLWTGQLWRGYARHRFGQAHRVVYRQFGGFIPEGHDLHHECENKRCVNPEHMEPKDKVPHLRGHWETRGPFELETIRALKAYALENPRVTSDELGQMFGMKPESVRNIVNGRTWREAGERIKPVLVCQVCGVEFMHKRRQSRYCSEPCYREANRASKRKAA